MVERKHSACYHILAHLALLWNSLLSYLISSYQPCLSHLIKWTIQHFSLVVLWNSPSASYLISLILSTMPLSSYWTNYLFFSIPSLFGLVDNIIKFKDGHISNMCLPHQSDTSPYGYLFTPYSLLWLDDIHLCFYWLIRLLIYLSSYLLICLYLWLIW